MKICCIQPVYSSKSLKANQNTPVRFQIKKVEYFFIHKFAYSYYVLECH